MNYKTTQKNFDYFTKRVKYWASRFGIGDWEVDTYWIDLEPTRIAETGFDSSARHCVVRLGKDFGGYKITNHELDCAARHEVLEVVLFDLQELASRLGANEEIISVNAHAAIHRIETALDHEPTVS